MAQHDDLLKVRVPKDFRRAVEEAARREGVTKAELVRRALAPATLGAATPDPTADAIASQIVDALTDVIRAEVRAALDERGEEVAKALAPDPALTQALDAIVGRVARAERAAGV